ncbi:hypothetical protein U2150_03150 [Methanothermobacter wolfeii]|uniref:Zinc-ribbon domain-containing protein n=1 Tax=Methanothermobacter wolfeii TaxID=145261 RepID=A0ABU8TV50_METWO|nr:hypothetical protein [Methanothermobacter wolfeii]NLM03386.1 hypothetical protein [Methanothermobacter wolfeii]
MALKPCRECGGIVSTDASACPHCGAKQGSAAEALCACLCLLGLMIFILGLLSS